MFSAMKKNRDESLNEILNSEKKQFQNDDSDTRFWKATTDKAGNASAVIRFLPASEGEKTPFVKLFHHGFQSSSGKWYIENSLTTIGENDPAADMNTALWKNGTEGSPERVLVSGVNGKNARKRKLSYYANVYVVSDPANPENNGKVFVFKFGAKIHEKIMAKLKPIYDDVKPSLVYDLWEGSNFRLRIKKSNGQTNYDDCEWDTPSPLLGGDDAKLEALWNTQYKLQEFVAPDKFKSYDQLKKRLIEVIGYDDLSMNYLDWADGTTGKSQKPKAAMDAPAPSKAAAPKAAASVDDDDMPPWSEGNDVGSTSADDFFSSLDD